MKEKWFVYNEGVFDKKGDQCGRLFGCREKIILKSAIFILYHIYNHKSRYAFMGCCFNSPFFLKQLFEISDVEGVLTERTVSERSFFGGRKC